MNSDRSRGSVVIDATPAQVMAVIADVVRYPEWVNEIRDVEILKTTVDGLPGVVRFVLDAGIVADDYALAYTWADDDVSWHLVRGTSIKAIDGGYRLHSHDGGTQVEYELSITLGMPLLNAFKRKAESAVIGTTLNALKARVEALPSPPRGKTP
jgi:ribosome-associated toxin RatA of RatAB toxin-antitoxin module